jgi:hypothetical protein
MKKSPLVLRRTSLRPLTVGELADVQGGYLTQFSCLPNSSNCVPYTSNCVPGSLVAGLSQTCYYC